ncbi:MAG TPA: hypothetical protein VK742_06105 [Candidatus Sulfotelmatobacter sp.]|jgi:hypothetical protein|nr:hypothetical protein [Candidatus Sulfotelmatobacter sp.]
MSSPQSNQPQPAFKSALPGAMIFFGGVFTLAGLIASYSRNHLVEFAFSWLLAFMFYYSIALGALFMVMVHHLTDAGWSVGIRRFCEHIASLLFPWLAIMFIPVLLLAPKIYAWMSAGTPETNNLIAAKYPVFTVPGFWVTSAIFFAILWFFSWRLCSLSLKQDEAGDVAVTRKMRFHSGWGVVVLALTLTFSGVFWMQATSYQWFSAMYGVYFFASSVWAALALIYVIAVAMLKQGILTQVLKPNYFYFIGVLLLAFTLLAAYTEFAQYFVVWNANMPEETFWYLQREQGGWWILSMVLIVGKFFVPFFALLPIHTKTNFKVLVPVCLLIGVMHYADLAFNILPAWHPGQHHTKWLILHLGTVLLMGGILGKIFICKFNAHPPYPQRDPHVLEAMGVSQNVVSDLVDANAGGAK